MYGTPIVLIADIIILVSFSLLFCFFSYIENARVAACWKKEKEKATILKELSGISSKVQDEEENLLNYPNIAFYLSQVSLIFRFHGFDINRIRVLPLEDLPDYPKVGFSKEEFMKELFSLPEESGLLNLTISCSDLFGRIYRIKHPVKYAWISFKKNLVSQILLPLLLHWWDVSKRTDPKAEQAVESKSLGYNFVNEPEPLPQ